jgi:hypothetical protein
MSLSDYFFIGHKSLSPVDKSCSDAEESKSHSHANAQLLKMSLAHDWNKDEDIILYEDVRIDKDERSEGRKAKENCNLALCARSCLGISIG